MKRRKKSPRKKLIAYLDALWSKLTKQTWELRGELKCAWCGKTENLQSDHIINRHKYPTRWRLENCVILDVGCHLFRKKREPWEWSQMVINKIGSDRYDFLNQMGNSTEKVDLEVVKRYLENAQEEIRPQVFGAKNGNNLTA